MNLGEIVPEYHSKNLFVRTLFYKRLDCAIRLAKYESSYFSKIIDLGCGEGALLKLLEKEFGESDIFGIDIEPNILNLERASKVEIRVTDLRNSGFPDNFFDLAFCLDVLEHFEYLNEPAEEIRRILKPNGLLIISLPKENNLYKFCRMLVKGTTSAKEGPCSSPHFFGAKFIENFIISSGFREVKKIVLPSRLMPLFDLISFRK